MVSIASWLQTIISGNHINTNIASHLIIKQPEALAALPVFIQTCWMVSSGDTIVSVVLHNAMWSVHVFVVKLSPIIWIVIRLWLWKQFIRLWLKFIKHVTRTKHAKITSVYYLIQNKTWNAENILQSTVWKTTENWNR